MHQIAEKDVAEYFACKLETRTRDYWKSICEEMNSSLGCQFLDSKKGMHKIEYLMMILSGDVQSIRNIYGGTQGDRLEEYVIENLFLTSPENIQEYCMAALDEYEEAWESEEENPVTAVPTVFIERIENLDETVYFEDLLSRILAVTVLGSFLIGPIKGFWKDISKRYEVVKDE